MRTASSMGAPSRLAVTRLLPIPSVMELPSVASSPPLAQLYKALPWGSANTHCTWGFCCLR